MHPLVHFLQQIFGGGQHPQQVPVIGERPNPKQPVSSPQNRGAVPNGLRFVAPIPKPVLHGPAQFTASQESDGTYISPGSGGPGPVYLNPSHALIHGEYFSHLPAGRIGFSNYQVAPIRQPNFPQYNRLQTINNTYRNL